MTTHVRVLACAVTLGGLPPAPAFAHSFGPIYTLPLPFWMYGWGAAATVLVSFLAVAWFVNRPANQNPAQGYPLFRFAIPRGLICGGRVLALLTLLLCISAGLLGSPKPYANISMTLFWVIFLVGLAYVVAILGDGFAALNPWRTLAQGWQRLPLPQGTARYPAALEAWPATFLLVGFVWLELFGQLGPQALGWWLLAYTALMLLGSVVFGSDAWLRNAEIFGHILRLLGSQSVTHAHQQKLHLRWPFLGAEHLHFASMGSVMFVLAWLAGTAFDGLHQTVLFHRWFFTDMYHAGLHLWAGDNMREAFPWMRSAFFWWQSLCLVLLPLLYGGIYYGCMGLTRRIVGAGPGTLALGRAFAPSLIPIALVYHAAHYYTLLQTQGIKIIALISDPFGWNWNLFGTADWLQRTIIPDTATVWRAQLGLIVIGHIAGVVIAHRRALQLYTNPRQATLSQIPFVLLMVGFTVFGLWILSLPGVSSR